MGNNSVKVEHCGASLSEQCRAASFWANQELTSYINRTQHTGNACMQLAGIKSGLLLTSTDSKHTVWLDILSSYTIRRGDEKSLRMTDIYTVSYSTISCLLRYVSSHVCLHNLQPSYSKRSCSRYFS